ncbi:hypothetical protein ES705_27577 [subsurface metagenome]
MPYKNKEDRKTNSKKYYQNNKQKIIEYHNENKEHISEMNKQWYQKNKEHIDKLSKQWREKNPNYHNEWRERNKEYLNEKRKKWYEENKEIARIYQREYLKKYPRRDNPKYKVIKNLWMRNKYKIDLKYNLNQRMSRAILKALKGNKANRHWENLVGYTIRDLERRLKRTMPQGYTWQDYLEGKLHIDHVIPKSAFNFTRPEHTDFKRCWALENLRLLPAKENLIKHNHLNKPFQPTLRLESKKEIIYSNDPR